MRDKIAEIAKMSHEELHAYRWELTSKTCECTKLKRISSHMQIVQMHEMHKDHPPTHIGKLSDTHNGTRFFPAQLLYFSKWKYFPLIFYPSRSFQTVIIAVWTLIPRHLTYGKNYQKLVSSKRRTFCPTLFPNFSAVSNFRTFCPEVSGIFQKHRVL